MEFDNSTKIRNSLDGRSYPGLNEFQLRKEGDTAVSYLDSIDHTTQDIYAIIQKNWDEEKRPTDIKEIQQSVGENFLKVLFVGEESLREKINNLKELHLIINPENGKRSEFVPNPHFMPNEKYYPTNP